MYQEINITSKADKLEYNYWRKCSEHRYHTTWENEVQATLEYVGAD
jgi:hypothetical protein